ncbi:MAG: [citrate (pro-3S)-lyase] ligase [Treponema sp.]|nr:[citrate (pro-3S)-lyase] ligase [Treponema sp.]
MEDNFEIRIGTPFTGYEKQLLVEFLKQEELDYDEAITYSVVLWDDERIIASGSCQNNILKCIAVSKDYQGKNLLAPIMSQLFQHMFENGINHFFGFTKPKNKMVFSHMGLYPVAETDRVLLLENKKDGFRKYLDGLKTESEAGMLPQNRNPNGTGIGAIVANCNPFTKGHRYLVEQAASACEWVHLFVLSTEQEWISSKARFDMVKAGTKDIKNVILHVTSDYLISPVVFPTYFIKEKDKAFTFNCMLDIRIFCDHIAKELGITRRFVGTEPTSEVTRLYNDTLLQYLPQSGIDVTVVERLQMQNKTVSASTVRESIKNGSIDDIAYMLPQTTYDYLRTHVQA